MNPVISKKPAEGYNLWAAGYDNQPDNLILHAEEEIFSTLLYSTTLYGKRVADIGCGTGRHWYKLLAKKPLKVVGYDVSEEMLGQLKKKFPLSETYLVADGKYSGVPTLLFDVIVSTLTIAHIPDFQKILPEWNKILKPGADIIITDYHPEALKRNAKRTFKHGDKTISLESFIYPLKTIRSIAKQLGWTELRFTERKIDEAVKPFYENQNAVELYKKFYGMPLLYGIHLKKSNDTP